MKRVANICAFTLLTFCMVRAAHAQMVGSDGKRIDAFMVDEAPVIDGILDDDAWAFATLIDDLHEIRPDEYKPPSEKSIIYVVYTKDALYVAGRFRDREPGKIGAKVLRQGDYSFGEDSFSVMLDPFNNERSGYVFDLSANAIRNQALFANVTSQNWRWRGIWQGATSFTDDGWIAEIEIPFKTLSFDPDNETWGFNVARYIGRRGEQMGWVSANRDQNPAVFGKISGMSGIEQGVGLDVVPSIRASQSKNFSNGNDTTSSEAAVDVFYKLTPAMTASLTVNTDFSGTGVDERQINLTRFGLFFPEKRAFFLQDADIFEFGRIGGQDFSSMTTIPRSESESGRPFFSRRIGLGASGQTVDINVGGKLTGRLGGLDVGVLAIQQDEPGIGGSKDLFVGRLAANVLDESSVGVIVTHGDPNSALDNTLAGIDFRYLDSQRPGGGTIEAGLWYQQTETEGLNGNDAAYGLSLSAPNSVGLRGGIAYKELQENFNPALGFVNRINVSDLTVEAGYVWLPRSDFYREFHSGIDYQRIETLQGALQSQTVTLRPLEITTHSSDRLTFRYQLIDEVLDSPFEISDGVVIPAGEYSFNSYCINMFTAEHRVLKTEVSYCGGDFFDGSQSGPNASFIWRPSPHFKFSAGYNLNDIDLPNGSFTTRLASVRADIAFTNTWYWENFVQYDNVSNGMGLNSIVRWVPKAGREMVLVVNREFIDYNRDRSFTTVSGDVTFKFSTTLRF